MVKVIRRAIKKNVIILWAILPLEDVTETSNRSGNKIFPTLENFDTEFMMGPDLRTSRSIDDVV